ncbi:ZP domain-containing protein [Meloidogyne graminicola]|uniref:ZP domain-containing protein n=1 Tax=Meloidogyne graminicola TaxID=189291 RepID=A0A8S9ZEC0_9BILA|nr:ZP domain-containing protein [Meloidogyne graminicola]
MALLSTFVVIFFMLLNGVFTQLQNSLMEAPKLTCEHSRIKMFIHTWLPFSGSVYAKGFFNKDICRVQGNGIGHTANITIPVSADCGMRRRRNVNPHGLSLEMDVIIMFHRRFLTKNDRASICCQVDDGQGSTQKLLDENGCSLDEALFGSIEYKTDLEAIQRGNAFKFADRVTIYFNCQLRLELKNGWRECQFCHRLNNKMQTDPIDMIQQVRII